jgi:hypothetical protein
MPLPRSFSSQVVRIGDLAVVRPYLEGYHFEGCLIVGPVILVPQGNTQLHQCHLGGTLSNIYWKIEDGREWLSGAVGLVDCIFEGCRFDNVGWAGDEGLRQSLLAWVPTQQQPDPEQPTTEEDKGEH